MAGLRKPILNGLFEDALTASGWKALTLPPGGVFPARYQLSQGPQSVVARLYIWTITHGGGKKRSAKEFRIQLTDGGEYMTKIDPEPPDGRTLIMGWWPTAEVFAGFDYNYHKGPLGNSPSIQVGEDALRRAAEDGMAVHVRGNSEIVIAFRPEFMGTYIAQMDDLHKIGLSAKEIALLGRIAADPEAVSDAEIDAGTDAGTDKHRQRVMVDVRRAARSYKFSKRVLKAYKHRCAFCGVQLGLLDAAHILPVAHPDGVDRTSNGVAVCTLHHRAYDNGLITFDEKFRVHLAEKRIADLEAKGRTGGLPEFKKALRPEILLPDAEADRPVPGIVREANKHRGWKLKAGPKAPSKTAKLI